MNLSDISSNCTCYPKSMHATNLFCRLVPDSCVVACLHMKTLTIEKRKRESNIKKIEVFYPTWWFLQQKLLIKI